MSTCIRTRATKGVSKYAPISSLKVCLLAFAIDFVISLQSHRRLGQRDQGHQEKGFKKLHQKGWRQRKRRGWIGKWGSFFKTCLRGSLKRTNNQNERWKSTSTFVNIKDMQINLYYFWYWVSDYEVAARSRVALATREHHSQIRALVQNKTLWSGTRGRDRSKAKIARSRKAELPRTSYPTVLLTLEVHHKEKHEYVRWIIIQYVIARYGWNNHILKL